MQKEYNRIHMLDTGQPLKNLSRTEEDHGMTREVSSLAQTSPS
jgi:hypothetical protein